MLEYVVIGNVVAGLMYLMCIVTQAIIHSFMPEKHNRQLFKITNDVQYLYKAENIRHRKEMSNGS